MRGGGKRQRRPPSAQKKPTTHTHAQQSSSALCHIPALKHADPKPPSPGGGNRRRSAASLRAPGSTPSLRAPPRSPHKPRSKNSTEQTAKKGKPRAAAWKSILLIYRLPFVRSFFLFLKNALAKLKRKTSAKRRTRGRERGRKRVGRRRRFPPTSLRIQGREKRRLPKVTSF